MSATTVFLALIALSAAGFLIARRRAAERRPVDGAYAHSLPAHYGIMVAAWGLLPAVVAYLTWLLFSDTILGLLIIPAIPLEITAGDTVRAHLYLNEIRNAVASPAALTGQDDTFRALVAQYRLLQDDGTNVANLLAVLIAFGASLFAYLRVRPDVRAREKVEKLTLYLLLGSAAFALLITVGIVFSLAVESWRFFDQVSPRDFLFGLQWSPQTALRADQVGSSGSFGAVPLFAGTLLITLIAMIIAGPMGLMSAIFMNEYASPKLRRRIKPFLEILAGIPTVVYGFFAALVVAPHLRAWGQLWGLDIASESALAAGLVMGLMIIPFVSSLSDDALGAVPRSLRDGSLALGATRSETVLRVMVPTALPGIMSAFLLAISRAVGETMIVVMAAGLSARLTANPFEAVTTVTVQIVTLLTGDQEFDSAKTLSAFALGLALFVLTLILNVAALKIVRRYRERYE